jgi:formylglycine-generating enzyme required for sulfatase activity
MPRFWRQGLPASSIIVCAVVGIVIITLADKPVPGRAGPAISDLVELQAASFSHRRSGEFTRDGRIIAAPLAMTEIPHTFAIMRHQVSGAEYRRCVEAGACPPLDGDNDLAPGNRPVVKVSWRDAQAYAAWLSHETGDHYRLPTDEEWAYAAASRFNDDVLPQTDDPGQRALAIYARDRNDDIAQEPQPIGTFGANENGLVDVAGNVWEWTDTCFTRYALDARGEAVTSTIHCGVRVVEGRHRAYMTDFVRDARLGGCSAGAPPTNLGFRLVRDAGGWRALRRLVVEARRLVRSDA